MLKNLQQTKIRVSSIAIFAVLNLLFSLSLGAKSSGGVGIKNFGKVNDHYFRGAQPKQEGFADLQRLGIRTVIDLQDGDRRDEQSAVKSLGLNYINIPMDDHERPYDEQVQKFLSVAQDQKNWPIFVHCAGGRHRTGAMTAVYRMTTDGWNIDQAYNEMKDYGFYTSWGHGGYKDYVYDFYNSHNRAAASGIASGAVASQK
ncbi:MAG TPA: dual specificity protein phosphatase family protein [Acidobacteriota bacterium]|jgi:protein tyrosine/serine phosphatase